MTSQQPENTTSDHPPGDTLASHSLATFLGNLAAKIPAPGGGASACLTGAIAAAQARMVVAFSLNKKTLAEHQALLADADARLARATELFLNLADEDARAYSYLNELERLPAGDPRRDALPAARTMATDVPRASVAAAGEVLRVIEPLVGKSNPHLRSDLAIAAVLARAACESGAWNVWINTRSLPDAERAAIDAELDHAKHDAAGRASRIEHASRG